MPIAESGGHHRVTFELEGHVTALTLWHSHIPAVGEKVLLAHSEWTVIRIEHEVVEWKGRLSKLTRYVIDDERPVGGDLK